MSVKQNLFVSVFVHKCLMMLKDHYIFIIAQLWLISHPRSSVALLETGTPGASIEISQEIFLLVPEVPVSSRTTVLLG